MPPQSETVCGDCITDDELTLLLGPVIGFILSVFLERTAKEPASSRRDDWLRALEMARSPFVVRNINPDTNGRYAALRVLGLAE